MLWVAATYNVVDIMSMADMVSLSCMHTLWTAWVCMVCMVCTVYGLLELKLCYEILLLLKWQTWIDGKVWSEQC